MSNAILSPVAAAGLFVAVPLVGNALMQRVQPARDGAVLDRLVLALATGIMVLTIPLLGLLVTGMHDPELLGAAGWALSAILVARGLKRRRNPRLPRKVKPEHVFLAVGLAVAFGLYVAAPTDTTVGGRDMSVYAHHAMYMARSGQLEVAYPWPSWAATFFADAFAPPSGYFPNETNMTVQFGHVFPAWLSQAYSVGGVSLLHRANAFVTLLGLLSLYAVVRRFTGDAWAAVAVVFLALNASTVWIARITLSEPLTQVFVWSALLLLLSSRLRFSEPLVAGSLLAFGLAVRLDALLVLPLAFAAHAGSRIFALQSWDWRAFHVGLVTVAALSMAYYVLFSGPYLEMHSQQVALLLGLTAVSVLLLALTFVGPLRIFLRRVAGYREVAPAAAAVAGATILLLLFVRPAVEPFALIDRPDISLHGTRSYVEEALPNLADYLSITVVMAALAGLVVIAYRPRTFVTGAASLVVLVVVAGYSALYLWNQSIVPDHYWAIRRFVPVVIPGFVLIGWWAASRAVVGSAVRLPFLLGLSAMLVGYSISTAAPMAAVRQDWGAYDAIRQAAAYTPGDEPILGIRLNPNLVAPLYLGQQRQMVPLNVATEEGRAAALTWIESRATQTGAAWAYSSEDLYMPGLIYSVAGTVDTELTHMEHTVDPLPTETSVQELKLLAYEITGVRHIGASVGGRATWTVDESGFHVQEEHNGVFLRWTQRSASLAIPLVAGERATNLQIDLAQTAPEGTDLTIVVDGRTIYRGIAGPGSWSRTFPIRATGPDEVDVILRSETWRPVETGASTDTRRLGVMVRSVVLLGNSPAHHE